MTAHMTLKPFAAMFLALGVGCQAAPPEESSSTNVLSVEEFARNAKAFDGREITIQGYLFPMSPDLALYINDTTPSVREAPIAIVEDFELRQRKTAENNGVYVNEASILEELGCTNRYAAVTGIAGQSIREIRGIIKIASVRIYNDATFSEPGIACYSA